MDQSSEQWKEDYAREFPHADAEAEAEDAIDVTAVAVILVRVPV